MTPRIKKLVGTVVIVPVLFVYFFAAAVLGALLPHNILLQLVYFIAAGLAWIFPMKWAMQWMSAEPKEAAAPTDPV
ncbi:MAG: DUF2842 domain-containing protein [Pseudomonadota bacterium]